MRHSPGDGTHVQRLNAEAVLQAGETVEHEPQKVEVSTRRSAKIVRVPPKMKKRPGFGGMRHLCADALEQHPIEPAPADWAEKTARHHIHHPFDDLRLMHMMAGNRQVRIGKTRRALSQTLFRFFRGTMEPDALIAAKRAEAKLVSDAQMLTAHLVAREDEALDGDPEPCSHRFCGFEIGSEGLWRPPPPQGNRNARKCGFRSPDRHRR